MAWEDPWKRYWRRRERLTWDPWYRYEEERRRWFEDPWFRYNKEKEREFWDPWYRAEKRRERGSWDGSSYGYSYGSSSDQQSGYSGYWSEGMGWSQHSEEPIGSGLSPELYFALVNIVDSIVRKKEKKKRKLFGFLPWPF